MIESAAEFVGLRTSEDPGEYQRAAREEAPLEVWLAVIEDHPEMRQWVAHNKTVPAVVLERLAGDSDPTVRWTVAIRRSAPAHVPGMRARRVGLQCGAGCRGDGGPVRPA
ncbi:hypothetical protein GCM10023113_07300 [Cellulomonas oligotrophica]|uniref:Uncharacterized protein n=1 Tax=Cellulomonas oligotrophica TaxID=931536 RepID=A0ABQ4D559_9CELL|nr:hypothetical protein Col01nite_00040 [Cellulomonas oligotrophica]